MKVFQISGIVNVAPETSEKAAIIPKDGGCVFVCGNCGSPADSEHIVGELVKSFRKKRPADGVFTEKFLEVFPSDEELIK